MNTIIRSLFLSIIFNFFSSSAYSAATSVSVGTDHSCAIVDGGLLCWGGNSHGQLGNGTITSSTTPVQVSGLDSGVTAVSAGRVHTCAISRSEVYCWGDNQYNQVGKTTSGFGSPTIPQLVPGLNGATAISAGSDSSCAIQNNTLKCWGFNLGMNPISLTDTPTIVSGLESGVTNVAVGRHACAVVNGSAKCWGINFKGQLGNSSQADSISPIAVSGDSSGYSYISTSAGAQHTCSVRSGKVLCWGFNSDGQLGNGVTGDSQTPVNVSGILSGATAVSTTNSSSCAIVNGNVFCWGNNGAGRLGNNSTAPSLVPVPTASLNGQARSITSGEYRTCVSTTDDKVYCWGAGVGNTPTEISFSAAQQIQSQTITFTSPGASKIFVAGLTFSISATSTSNLPISFTTNSNGYNCTVTGSTVTMINQGTCTITASQSGNANYLAATPVSQTIELTPKVFQAQTVTIQGEINQQLPVGGTIAITATSSSGLPVMLSSRSPNVCTVTNNVVKTVAATGRCDLWGDQSGNDTFAPAYAYYQVWILFSENRTPQSLSLDLGGSRTASIGDTFFISATASSGLPVDLGVSPIQVCRASGNVITVMGAGTCNVHAYQGGNSNYLPSTTDSSFLISIINKQLQTITLTHPPSVSMMAGDQFTISGTASSGLPITLTNLSPTVCSISGWTVAVIKEGLCAYRATQAGNSNYISASIDGGTNIIMVQGQTISFQPPSLVNLAPGQQFVVPVSASSGLAVTISSVSPAVCTVSGTTVTVVAAGYCQLQAYQAGTTTIKPVTVSSTVNIVTPATTTAPTISVTNNGSSAPGTQMVISVVQPIHGATYQLFFRGFSEQWTNERSIRMTRPSFEFSMPSNFEIFISVAQISNEVAGLKSTEVKLKSVQPSEKVWSSRYIGRLPEGVYKMTNTRPSIELQASHTGIISKNQIVTLGVIAQDPDKDNIFLSWRISGGEIAAESSNLDKVKWKSPNQEGIYLIRAVVSDEFGASSSQTFIAVVR